MRKLGLLAVTILGLAGINPAGAAEYDILQPVRVEGGYAVFQGTAEVQGSAFSVGGSSFAVKGGIAGIGTSAPGSILHIKDNAQQGSLVGTGTLSSSNKRVTGAGTFFYSQVKPGYYITSNGQTRVVVAVNTDAVLEVDRAFSPALSGNAFFYRQPAIALYGEDGARQFAVSSGVVFASQIEGLTPGQPVLISTLGVGGLYSPGGLVLTEAYDGTPGTPIRLGAVNFSGGKPSLALYAGEAEVARISTAGYLGIGTTSPQYRLVVSSGAGEAGNMLVISTGTSNVIRLTGDGSVHANRYYGDGSNLTGIGGTLSGGETPKLAYWTAANSLGNAGLTQDSGGLTVQAGTFTVQGNAFSVGGSTLAAQYGKIGIGTSTPAALLHISSAAGVAGNLVLISTGASNVIRMTGAGAIYANKYYGDGSSLTGTGGNDSLGTHIATKTLDMASFNIVGVSSVNFRSNVFVTSATVPNYGGVYVSSHLFVNGKLYGDGSALSGIAAGDSLGTHIATQTLRMQGYGIQTSSYITAGAYQINGSTVLAILGGNGSIAVGMNFSNNSTGEYNVFVGSGAGRVNTTGRRNTFIGAMAGFNNDNDQMNTFVGSQSGYSNNAGWGNVFLGDTAGYSNTSGSENTILGGYMAGYENTTGAANTFLGNYAGQSNTQGGFNTYVGYDSGGYGDIGEKNVSIGASAGADSAAGSRNVSLGFEAAFSGRTHENTAVGYQAARYNLEGGSNAVVGAGAGRGASGNSYAGNSLLGWNAGYALTTGGENTLLGWQAGSAATSGSRNIVIGRNQGTSAPAVSDELNIGGVLFGKLDSKVIGISTRTPQAALDVVSTGTLASQYAQIWRDSDGVIRASMTADGKLFANISAIVGGGDNLGGHTATQDLNLAQYSAVNVASISMVGKGLQIGTDLTASANGVFISTSGQVLTVGAGNGTAAPGTRGVGAVDLQTYRTNASSVAAGAYSVIGGGRDNRAGAPVSVVAGGSNNSIGEAADGAFIGAGSGNSISPWDYAVIVGGENNSALQYAAFVGAGTGNRAGGGSSVVVGGDDNYASNNNAFIGGGGYSVAGGFMSVIAGGNYNRTLGNYTTIGGGDTNEAYGNGAAVPGGRYNSALGADSFAAGFYSSSTAGGSFTWTDSQGVANLNSVVDRTLFKNRGGFMVTGSTNTYMTAGKDRGLLVTGDGLVGIATGTPKAAIDVVSSATASNVYAQIWRNASGVEVASITSQGKLYADISAIIGGGDNLGNHNAGQRLNMGAYAIWSSTSITAARYQIGGSTVLALSGVGSFAAGPEAGRLNYADYNTFVGYQAGYTNATAWKNVFVGYQAGYSNNTGQYNAFLGNTAGYANAGASYNSFFGDSAGASTVGGGYNSYFGASAGQYNTSGQYNAGLGFYAGLYNQTGSANALLGADAGRGTTNNSFSSSTIMGYQAGRMLMTGSDNIFVGYKAGYAVTTGTGNIVIGYDKGVSAVSASNELNIGGVLYGKLDARTIGISTRVPQATLDIVSTGTATNIYAQIWRRGDGQVVASMTSTGQLYATVAGAADNLGNHAATQDLSLAKFALINVSTISTTGIYISSYGVIQSTGVGTGTVAGNSRGVGAVDLQVNRGAGTQVASGAYAVVAGGQNNTALGQNSTVAGGSQNTAGNQYATVAGGVGNNAGGDSAMIPGGASNVASGNFSFAAGRSATASGVGSFLWADSANISVTNSVQDRVRFKALGGFMVSGSTSPAMAGGVNRGLFVTGDGLVGIATGTPQAALDVVSSATATNVYAQIWRNSSGVAVASITSQGTLYADASALRNIPGDSLGSHVATTTLMMGGYGVNTSSHVSAAAYQIYGSTVLAVLPGGNTLVGAEAGYFTTTGGSNSFFGGRAGYANTTGDANTFIGAQAGEDNTGGYNNLFAGQYSGANNTTGSENVFLGASAGGGNIDGSANAVLGVSAAYGGVSFSSSVILGYQAGYGLSGSSGNILIGYRAGESLTTGARNIVIGYEQNTSASLASNELNIGGVLFGDLQSGKIGVATAAPQGLFQVGGGTLTVTASGNVGIGLTSPDAKLQVQAYEAGKYTMHVSTSATPGYYSIAVTSTGITNVKNLVIENRTSDPAAPVVGQIWLRVD